MFQKLQGQVQDNRLTVRYLRYRRRRCQILIWLHKRQMDNHQRLNKQFIRMAFLKRIQGVSIIVPKALFIFFFNGDINKNKPVK